MFTLCKCVVKLLLIDLALTRHPLVALVEVLSCFFLLIPF